MKDIRNRADVERLVDAFYIKVRANDILGPIFDEIMQVDWATHLPKMYDFWEQTLFHRPLYKGNPVTIHQKVHTQSPLKKEQFDTWLQLFNETIDENFQGNMARQAKVRALSIATVLQIKTAPGSNEGLPISPGKQ